MNPDFDFRDDSVWDETPNTDSVGDDLFAFRNRVIGWTIAILTFLFLVMGCLS